MQKVIAALLMLLTAPAWPPLYLAVKLDSKGPFIFRQKRAGKNRQPFTMYKIRTMVENAESLKKNYLKLNEASGPVFKIKNDPRYTKVGKLLSRLAIDELPQLVNVAKGEMALVGPRPLPTDEAANIPAKYQKRFSVLPGMTSTWIISGAHKLTFEKWMKLDLAYVKNKSALNDLRIFATTIYIIITSLKKLAK